MLRGWLFLMFFYSKYFFISIESQAVIYIFKYLHVQRFYSIKLYYVFAGGGAIFDEPPTELLSCCIPPTACLIFFIESDVALHPLLSVFISFSTV